MRVLVGIVIAVVSVVGVAVAIAMYAEKQSKEECAKGYNPDVCGVKEVKEIKQ